ncbi:MAG: hypothetical protein WCT24_03170 [Patescibacteria group bacterium]|jgi:hypothetical protein
MEYLSLFIFSPIVAFFIHLFIAIKKKYPMNWCLVWPILLGIFAGLVYGFGQGTSGAVAGIAMGTLMVLAVEGMIMFIATLIVRWRKRCSSGFVIVFIFSMIGVFFFLRIIDMTFITTRETGEKGNAWVHSQYPDWRILD